MLAGTRPTAPITPSLGYSITASEATNVITNAVKSIVPVLSTTAPFVAPIFAAATFILQQCQAAKSNRSDFLALGDLVARASLSVKQTAEHTTVRRVHADALLKVLLEMKDFLKRYDTEEVDREHRVERYVHKLKAIICAKDIQLEIRALQFRLITCASFLNLDLQVRTVTGIDDVKQDTQQLLANNEALTQKIDELTLRFEQLADLAIFMAHAMERIETMSPEGRGRITGSSSGDSDRDRRASLFSEMSPTRSLVKIVDSSRTKVFQAAQNARARESTLPFNQSTLQQWMISSLEVQFEMTDDNLIGRGSSATVYKGFYHNEPVAVKLFHNLINNDPDSLETAISKEISTWMKLSGKPYILRLVGACTKVKKPYIVSEYCFSTADKYIRHNPQELMRIIYELSCGLETIHLASFIHRDIKSFNILITERKHVAIADFGLSKNAVEHLSQTSGISPPASVGTLNWMSPEQRFRPRQVSAKSDIWSFGMVMYEFVAGKVPFHDYSDEEIKVALNSENDRPTKPDGCSPKLWELIVKCWKSNPDERPTASDIRIFLENEFYSLLGSAVTNIDWTIFMSYCWKNSSEAFQMNQIREDTGCGPCDPRNLARKLTSLGHVTWLDVDRLKINQPLFEHLVDGLNPAKLAVICVSNEYSQSENCVREFKYIVNELKIPHIIVVVGPDSPHDWKRTVIGLLAEDKLYIEARSPLQQEYADDTFANIVDAVEDALNTQRELKVGPQIHAHLDAAASVKRLSNISSPSVLKPIKTTPTVMVEKLTSPISERRPNPTNILELAQVGDIQSQILVANAFASGQQGFQKDINQAFKWYKSAALAGNVQAEYEIGEMYQKGTGVDQDLDKAVEWFKRAAAKNHAQSQVSLGSMYLNGVGILASDPGKAVECFKKAASSGNPDGQNSLGLCYIDGIGVTKDLTKAIEWLSKASTQGHIEAQNRLALIYLQDNGHQRDEARAIELLKKGAALKNSKSQNLLGLAYRNGTGVKKCYTDAVEWFELSASQGNIEAKNNLAYMCLNGFGTPQDYQEAINLYTMTSSLGDTSGQVGLAYMHLHGLGVSRDLGRAFDFSSRYTKAAIQENSEAQCALGRMYQNGAGVERNLYKAFDWYQKSASQNNSDGQNNLGLMYLNGYGMAKPSFSKAFEWFQKSAKQGNPKGENNVGHMYEYGYGVRKDQRQAIEWYEKAANQDLEDAIKSLRRLGVD
ncbi:hypothetical protein HK100_003862 [Physocladia obscura]|uniref:Protein kinase domain-containing protein n=1 Tax=Physocladia obscura TaxID=109957 RepID=A0AAD5XKZ5_9FUNG|nr:hypothetical protein HK100_003862 [Physocladia obscura]